MPADPLSIGLSVGGSLLQSFNARHADRKRDKILRLIMERRARQQEEIDAALMGEVGTLRGETPEAERDKAMSEFVGQLRATRAAQPTSYGARGAVSGRETAEVGALQAGLGRFANREADITARIDSQRRMREGQGLRRGRLGTDLTEKTRLIDSADFLDQLRLNRVRKNPWLDLLGSAMKGAGSAGGFGGGLEGLTASDKLRQSSGWDLRKIPGLE